ncbi:MAG: 3-phosphoshikimate 1-carboxyvinyltransferase [bacterium]|nr:3-phosphoshikimate 1-carboxyvinyltransferase [bacterium]
MNCKDILPCRSIGGTISVPGDKSISHRAVILGALAEGDTLVGNFLDSADCRATVDIFRALGVSIIHEGGHVTVKGRGADALREPDDVLQAGNSGTTTRLMLGLLAGLDIYAVITGDASLRRRPMDRVTRPLSLRGADFRGRGVRMLAPVAVSGRRPLAGLTYELPVASAQIKTSLLLSGLFAEGPTHIWEPYKSRDHSERMLTAFGADISVDGNRVCLNPGCAMKGREISVPGDISSAAFFMVMAACVPGATLTLVDVGLNPTRTGVIDVLRDMGAHLRVEDVREEAGEPVGRVSVTGGELHGTTIDAPLVPRLIDEIPALAVAAALADGKTLVKDAAELRVKETDRIASVCDMLRAFGVEAVETADGMVVSGGNGLKGTVVDSSGDHRIAMAASIAAVLAEGKSSITDTDCIETSFPGFYRTLKEVCAGA